MTYEQVLNALADPTRRAIVDALRAAPQPVGALAKGMPISRPAVSQHLKVLGDAGLVTVRAVGTRRVYALAPDGIRAVRQYLDGLWDDALDAFARAAELEAERLNDD